MLLALSSLFGSPGGIPAFNQLLLRAASELCLQQQRRLTVLVLTDDADAAPPDSVLAQLPARALSPHFYQPCGGDRRRFALRLLQNLSPAREVCLGHVNLAPLGLLTRRYGVLVHGTEVWSPMSPLRRFALRRAEVVGSVSNHTQRCVQYIQGVAASRCLRVTNALPIERSEVQAVPAPLLAKEGTAATPLHVLSITRLHPDEPKGIDLVLRALPALPQLHYTVIGSGDALPRLRALASQLGVADRVRFLGTVSDAEKAQHLRRCDLFALPSSNEGFGIVYLEAQREGKPCLAVRVGGAPEAVTDEVTGLTVAPSAAAVQEGLARLAQDPVLRQRLGAAGPAAVAGQFCYPNFRARAFTFLQRIFL